MCMKNLQSDFNLGHYVRKPNDISHLENVEDASFNFDGIGRFEYEKDSVMHLIIKYKCDGHTLCVDNRKTRIPDKLGK